MKSNAFPFFLSFFFYWCLCKTKQIMNRADSFDKQLTMAKKEFLDRIGRNTHHHFFPSLFFPRMGEPSAVS